MAMKWVSFCLVAVLFGSLADAQQTKTQYTPPVQQVAHTAQQYTPPVQQVAHTPQKYTPPVQQVAHTPQKYSPPVQQVAHTPQKYSPPVQQVAHTPQKYTPPVQQVAHTPQKYSPPVQQVAHTPQKYTPPVQQVAHTPQKYTPPVQQVAHTPQKYTPPVQQVAHTPQKYTPPVQQVAHTPQKYTPPVQQVAHTPQKYSPPVQQVAHTPQKYTPPVQQVAHTPQKYTPPVQQVAHTPQKYTPPVQQVAHTPQRYTPAVQQAAQTSQSYTPSVQQGAQTQSYTPSVQQGAQTHSYTPSVQQGAQTHSYTPSVQQGAQTHHSYTPPGQSGTAPKYTPGQYAQTSHDAGSKSPPNQYNPMGSQSTRPSKTAANPSETSHSCEVEAAAKIQCGHSGISAAACDAINCCYDGQMCYYGKFVTVQCTKDGQFIVVVARDATLPNIDLESVSLLGAGQGCSPVDSSSAFAIYQFPVTACGTVMTEEPGILIYENRMASSYEVQVGSYGAITRDSTYNLLFQCRYVGVSVEALVIEVHLVPPPPGVSGPGPLRVELRLGSGLCTTKGCVEEDVAYTTFYTDAEYPVVKVLRVPVYAEVRILERADPNLALTLHRCWTTTTTNSYSFPQWDLLNDGCPYQNDRYQTALIPVGQFSGLAYPTHHRRFVFKMFTFVDQTNHAPLREKVYIHCSTSVCQLSGSAGAKGGASDCEPRCFRKRRGLSVPATSDDDQNHTIVTSGEVVFIDPSTSS